jgi:putative transcriptional regulator
MPGYYSFVNYSYHIFYSVNVKYICINVHYGIHLLLHTLHRMNLGNNIRRCRFDKDEMSQEDLADAIGVTRQTIHSIEKGKFIPSTLLAFKIARYFEKNVEEIFFLVNDEKNS